MANKPKPTYLILGKDKALLDSKTWVLEGNARNFLRKHVEQVANGSFFESKTASTCNHPLNTELSYAAFGVRKDSSGEFRFSMGRKDDYRRRDFHSNAKSAYTESMSDCSAKL